MKNFRFTRKLWMIAFIIVVLVLWGSSSELLAQCPMCRIGAETNLARGGTAGLGLNKGILLLLGLPYILVGTLGFIWWRNRKQVRQ